MDRCETCRFMAAMRVGEADLSYYDDDSNYYADLNAGGNLGGSWNFGGNISAAGYI